MDSFLISGAVIFATMVGFYAWQKPLREQLGYFGLAILVTVLMVAIRLAVTESGTGLFRAMTNPPYWKLLVMLLADAAILVAILAKAVAKEQRPSKRSKRRQ